MFQLVDFGVIGRTLTLESNLLKDFVTGNTQAELYKEWVKTHSNKFLVCPLSVELNLELFHVGAGGNTAKQLSNGLPLPENLKKVQQMFQELTPRLTGNNKYSLHIANKVYVKDGYKIKNKFKRIAVDSFGAETQNIHFAKDSQSASEINKVE